MDLQVFDSVAQSAVLYGQGWLQIGQLLLAFVLSSILGLEREWKDKRAGLRIYSSVGTGAALLMLISKHGFMDVLITGQVASDPSRVAAQVVTGVGFLGAGLIITRHGATHGLTTAATMWVAAAIGMAAGAGLWLLALVVTVLHFFSVLGYDTLAKRISRRPNDPSLLQVTYLDGHGVLRAILETMTAEKLEVFGTEPKETKIPAGVEQLVTLELSVHGLSESQRVIEILRKLDGVHGVRLIPQDS